MSAPGGREGALDVAAPQVVVNGEARALGSATRLLDLLAELGLDPRTVAVERNGEVLRRASLGEVEVRAGDRLEIVRFVQGG